MQQSAPSGEYSMITRESLNLSTPYEEPGNELEGLIAGAFAEVFKLDRVGANDEFFDVGGDSLLGEVLSGLISERTGRDFQISTLIEHGSPRRIAGLLGAKPGQPAAGKATRPPIFLVHGRMGFTLPQPGFRQAFAEGQELYVFELPGLRGGQSYDRVEDIAASYVARIVDRQPEGPILIAAFCVGAFIALEMAAQLAEMGRPVAQIILLDPSLPSDRPANLKRELKKKARLAHGKEHTPSPIWLQLQLLSHRLRSVVRSLTDKNAEFSEDVRRFRERLMEKEELGRSKLPGQPQSIEARAKLQAALWHYRPTAVDAPVVILASPDRDSEYPWNELIPRRRMQVVFKRHSEVSTEVGARLLQSIVDEALAGPEPAPARQAARSPGPRGRAIRELVAGA
jgi:thioesterase domain-containing protein